MIVYQCKTCGASLEFMKGSSTARCEYCLSVNTLPSASSEKTAHMYNRANQYRIRGEFDIAMSIYEQLLAEETESAELYWGLVLCRYGIEFVEGGSQGEHKPTCHRTSYESILNDADYLKTLELAEAEARAVYEAEAREIDRINSEILRIADEEEPYEIFICHKETATDGGRTLDSVRAQEIYDRLTEKGYRVFLARVTLEDKLGIEYEPYIFAALQRAKLMLLVGTSAENINSPWVKNEWSRFIAMRKTDKSKTIAAVFEGMSAEDFPKEIRGIQSQSMDKLGWMQDLLRGVDKIMGETRTVQNVDAAKETAGNIRRAENPTRKTAGSPKPQITVPTETDGMIEYSSDMKELTKADTSITTAVIPDSVTTLKKGAFFRCGKLTSVKLSSNISSISELAFRDCGSLAAIEIPEGVTSIEAYAFHGCGKLETVILPTTLKSIGERAFANCRMLKNIVLPIDLRKIGNGAFHSCKSLTHIELPESLRKIEATTFRECSSLEAAILPDALKVIGENAFAGCGMLKNINLPNGLREIENEAFNSCESLTHIELPSGLRKMGKSVFANCRAISKVYISKGMGLQEGGDSAFSGCNNLSKVVIPADFIDKVQVFFKPAQFAKGAVVYFGGTEYTWRREVFRDYDYCGVKVLYDIKTDKYQNCDSIEQQT